MKNGRITGAILSILIIAGFWACVSNSVEELYGLEECDTINVTWEHPVRAILELNCVPCHNEELSYNNVRHDSYEEELKVVNDGRLHGVINHLPGYSPMPYQRPKLPECELDILNAWINKGAPEN